MQHLSKMAVAILAVTVLLAGCAANPFASVLQPAPQASSPAPQITVSAPATPGEDNTDKDKVFAQAFTADYEQQFGETPSSALVVDVTEIAKSSCVYLKSHTWEKFKQEMAKVIVSASSDNDVRTRLAWSIGYAVGFYCPEYVQ